MQDWLNLSKTAGTRVLFMYFSAAASVHICWGKTDTEIWKGLLLMKPQNW